MKPPHLFRFLGQKLNRVLPASLQVRLTLGVTAVSILGMSSVAGWTSWRMQKILVTGHKENLVELSERVVQDIEIYRDMLPASTVLDRAIDNRTTTNTVLWVSQSGQIQSQSDVLNMAVWQRDGTADVLLGMTGTVILPVVYQIGDRYFVLCGGPLKVNGETLGLLYIATDITRDQNSLLAVLRTLGIASSLGSMVIAAAIAIYIRRSLRPLRNMSVLAGEISAQDLGQTQLQLDQAPDEVRELAQAFNRMLLRLSMAWTQQRQFVSDVSHELRTPLSLVRGYLQSTLRRCPNLTEPQREGLEIASSEADRTVRLLQDLLDLARADSGYLRLHPEKFHLKDLAVEVLNMTPVLGDRVVLEVKSAPLEICTDRERLKQVLINLLDNAVKYSDPNQPIALKLLQADKWVTIQVCDRGQGISPKHLMHLFEPFYRAGEDRSRATGGTGLGLSIVKTLVTRMGGRVGVQSTPGKGSIFTVTLPSNA